MTPIFVVSRPLSAAFPAAGSVATSCNLLPSPAAEAGMGRAVLELSIGRYILRTDTRRIRVHQNTEQFSSHTEY